MDVHSFLLLLSLGYILVCAGLICVAKAILP